MVQILNTGIVSNSIDSVSNGTTTDPKLEDGEWDLIRKPQEAKLEDSSNLHLEVHALSDGVLISVRPPEAPSANINHVPCDIVLVIDISGSMNADASLPTKDPSGNERSGLSVLDLTKHAALTILETLDEKDRLGLVTFANEANVVQALLPMTAENKIAARSSIVGLLASGSTNLWQGIVQGMEQFSTLQDSTSVPAIMVLTDGQPNQGCPSRGYVPKLRTYECPASIHTFGFGYFIRSGLLKSISEVGGGNYAFIPDAGMIGTVFIHAIANLQSTFATSANLEIEASEGLTLVETIGSNYVRRGDSRRPDQRCQAETRLNIPLGDLRYGQTRDILLRYGENPITDKVSPTIHSTLKCLPLDGSAGTRSTSSGIPDPLPLPQELISYHRSRSKICAFLSNIAPLSVTEEHISIPTTDLSTKLQELEKLIADLPAKQDELNKSLIEDLSGQVRLALEDDNFRKWGLHFLQSLHDAHVNQRCNSFKDPGPLQYGKNSLLFTKCRDELECQFDNLPAPTPSNTVRTDSGQRVVTVSMRQYNSRDNPCFTADCPVKLMSEVKLKVSDLKKGMEVWTPKGGRKIAAVLETRVENLEVCKIGRLVITPWHPIYWFGTWLFPHDVAESTEVYSGSIYSLLLEPDQNDEAHAVEVGGCLAVTLGHGVTQAAEENDARAHSFFGNYDKVLESFNGLPNRDGVFESGGVERDDATGLVCGFLSTTV